MRTALPRRLSPLRVSGIALLLLTGCQSHSAGRPSEALMSRDELNARGDALIAQGEARKREGMNMDASLYRRAGPNRAYVIREGDDLIQQGQRLKAMAAAR